jgi:Protein of unknown function (DUF1569)
MKTLLNARDFAETRARLAKLRPDSKRLWGRMTASQMICHLTDAYRGILGDGSPISPAQEPKLLGRTVVKWVALYAPVPWPHGLQTSPVADQEKGGTKPTEFRLDLAAHDSIRDRFLHNLDSIAERPHFIFGFLAQSEWARWAYLHTDHHLRQFDL